MAYKLTALSTMTHEIREKIRSQASHISIYGLFIFKTVFKKILYLLSLPYSE